jgi:hypothetical protein
MTEKKILLRNGLSATIYPVTSKRCAWMRKVCERGYPFKLEKYSKYVLDVEVEGITLSLLLADAVKTPKMFRKLAAQFDVEMLLHLVVFVAYNGSFYSCSSATRINLLNAVKEKVNPNIYCLLYSQNTSQTG